MINHATGMIRLNCCSHVSALETAPRSFSSCAVDCSPRPRRKAAGVRGVSSTQTFRALPPAGGTAARNRRPYNEAMSVIRVKYARVQVAIGLLILPDLPGAASRRIVLPLAGCLCGVGPLPGKGVSPRGGDRPGCHSGADLPTIGPRDRDAVASRDDHAIGQGTDSRSYASQPLRSSLEARHFFSLTTKVMSISYAPTLLTAFVISSGSSRFPIYRLNVAWSLVADCSSIASPPLEERPLELLLLVLSFHGYVSSNV